MDTVSKNTLKKRRQRANIKKDPVRLEETRKQDRLRKQEARALLREKEAKNKKIHDEQKKRSREAKQRYRAKMKAQRECDNIPDQMRRAAAGKKNRLKQLKASKQLKKDLQEKLEISNRKKEVLRVTNWRLRIKLKQNLQDQDPDDTACAFKSPSQKSRVVKKVKSSLPKTPEKRAEIIETISKSPRCRDILQKKGIIQKNVARRLQMANKVVETVSSDLELLKPKGGMTKPHQIALTALQQTALQIKSKYANQFPHTKRTIPMEGVPRETP